MIWTGAHTTHKLRYHVVLIPKYRKRVLRGAVAARLGALIRQACSVNGWEPEELAIQPDHARLLLQAQPRFSVSQIMRTLKGGTSRVLRQEFPGLEEYLCSIRLPVGRQFLGRRLSRGDRGRGGRERRDGLYAVMPSGAYIQGQRQ